MDKILNNSELKNCPFCGTLNETFIETNYLNKQPRMDGKLSAIISVDIRHWCPNIPGNPSQRVIIKTGRDRQSAIDIWNMRG